MNTGPGATYCFIGERRSGAIAVRRVRDGRGLAEKQRQPTNQAEREKIGTRVSSRPSTCSGAM